jgi:hypothetical protein
LSFIRPDVDIGMSSYATLALMCTYGYRNSKWKMDGSVDTNLNAPRVDLVDRRILSTDVGSSHFVGCRATNGRGRVSSKIQLFNPKSLAGVTRSDALYVLHGPTAYSLAAQTVWLQWCKKNGIKRWRDATADYLEQPEPTASWRSIANESGSERDEKKSPE